MDNQEKIKLLNEIENLQLRNIELEKIINQNKNPSTLLQRKALSRALLNIPTDAVMLVDKDCIIIDVNETTARRFVTFIENLIGTPLENLFSKTTSAKICKYIKKVFITMQPWRFEDEKLGMWSDVVFYPIFNIKQTVENIAVISRDITKLKEVERKLGQSNQKHKALLQAIPDPVVRCTRNGVIQDIQSSRFGFPIKLDKALIGKPIFSIIPAKYVHTLIFDIEKSLQTKKVKISEFKIESSEGVKFIEVRIVSESTAGFVVIFRDITERKKVVAKLIEAKEKAEKSEKLKGEFLAQMSHEIRSPIHTILSFTQLLESELNDKIEGELRESFTAIRNAGQRVVRTIDLILNMSQIQTNSLETHFRNINLTKEILEPLYQEYYQTAKARGLKLEFIKDTDDVNVEGDEYTLNQIIANLLNNAIKYTEKGEITLRVFRTETNLLAVEVTDTGIGISEEYLPKIFDSFTQEEQGYTRQYDGNGLGLALVKRYCQINNADIFVESEKWKGSTFRVVF